MISVLAHPEQRLKDTANNILATKEFVLNLVSEPIAEAMNITCIDAPPRKNELDLAKLKTAPSIKVKPPRVSASPVAAHWPRASLDPRSEMSEVRGRPEILGARSKRQIGRS
jgi:Flavin reductase like domain